MRFKFMDHINFWLWFYMAQNLMQLRRYILDAGIEKYRYSTKDITGQMTQRNTFIFGK